MSIIRKFSFECHYRSIRTNILYWQNNWNNIPFKVVKYFSVGISKLDIDHQARNGAHYYHHLPALNIYSRLLFFHKLFKNNLWFGLVFFIPFSVLFILPYFMMMIHFFHSAFPDIANGECCSWNKHLINIYSLSIFQFKVFILNAIYSNIQNGQKWIHFQYFLLPVARILFYFVPTFFDA